MTTPAPLIDLEHAGSLPGLFIERCRLTPNKVAYCQYDASSDSWIDSTWTEMQDMAARWQTALKGEGLNPGDRVAVMLQNSKEWVAYDLASLGLGLVDVPLFFNDRPENARYVLDHSGSNCLLIHGEEHWKLLEPHILDLPDLKRIISVTRVEGVSHDKLICLEDWLPDTWGDFETRVTDLDALATICYTSGTTGNPKGVMLSHRNILSNACSAAPLGQLQPDSVFLSFLPLSHMLERTVGYYLPMTIGAKISYCRSVPQLADDLKIIKPTHLVSVPRIYERIYNKIQDGLEAKSPIARFLFSKAASIGDARFEHQQGRGSWSPSFLFYPILDKLVGAKLRANLGGNMHLAISGGAPLAAHIHRLFLALGITIVEGYGLTESSPIICGNRVDANLPGTVGMTIDGVEVKNGDNNELLARGDNIMQGYWKNQQATNDTIDKDGWLHTGDQASIAEDGRVKITGRIKEIIVMASGEKVPPADIEMAIAADPRLEQVLVIGEGKPFLSMLAVPSEEHWPEFAKEWGLDPQDPESLENPKVLEALLASASERMSSFPGYAKVRKVALTNEPWTIENGLMTPTLKLKRTKILDRYETLVGQIYGG